MTDSCEGESRLRHAILDEKVGPIPRAAWHAGLAPFAFGSVFTLSQLSDAAGVPIALCIMKTLVGIPCPGCGITTSVALLTRSRISEALEANPAGPVVALFVIVQVLLVVAAAARFLPDTTTVRLSRTHDRVLVASLICAWMARFI
jgi:hypothetical protein